MIRFSNLPLEFPFFFSTPFRPAAAEPKQQQGTKRKAEESPSDNAPQKSARVDNPDLARGIVGTEIFMAQVSDGVTDELVAELFAKCGKISLLSILFLSFYLFF